MKCSTVAINPLTERAADFILWVMKGEKTYSNIDIYWELIHILFQRPNIRSTKGKGMKGRYYGSAVVPLGGAGSFLKKIKIPSDNTRCLQLEFTFQRKLLHVSLMISHPDWLWGLTWSVRLGKGWCLGRGVIRKGQIPSEESGYQVSMLSWELTFKDFTLRRWKS